MERTQKEASWCSPQVSNSPSMNFLLHRLTLSNIQGIITESAEQEKQNCVGHVKF